MTGKILIAQTGFLGDAVLTTGLIAAARKRFPEAELALLTTPAAAELMADQPALDQVLIDDKRGRTRSPSGFVRLAASLRVQCFAIALAAHKSARTALLLTAAGIPLRVGFRRWPQGLLYHKRVPYDTAEHYARRQLELLEPFGGAGEENARLLSMTVSEARRREARSILRRLDVSGDRRLVGVCPGSAWTTKRWPAERYGALVRALEERGFECIILGGEQDVEVGRVVVRAAGGQGKDLTGRTEIGVLPALLERMDVVVTNDSAPMHISSALRLPLAAIFCSTVPSQGYGPLSPASVVVGHDLDCRPCGRHGAQRCPLGTDACRTAIEVGEVVEAVEAALARGGRLQRGQAGAAGLRINEA